MAIKLGLAFLQNEKFSYLQQFSITLVSSTWAERTCATISLSVRVGAREDAMRVEMFSTSMACPRDQSVRKVLCMRFLAHFRTSSIRPRGSNWCNGKRLYDML